MNELFLKKISDKFPCQEIWHKNNYFWAFDIKNNYLSLTSGIIIDQDNFLFDTSSFFASNMEEFIDLLCENKRKNDFNCFAIKL